MDHVEGLVPSDNIPYTMDGWVIEATPEQQERMWWSGIDALAAVHRTDWRATGLEWLSMTDRGRPGLEQQLSYYRDFLDWATKGEKVPVIESTWQWLVEHQPAEDGEVVISWGDSRIGNIIWDDFQAAAVVDWEMASLAQPEMDLGWWLYFDRQFSEGLGVPRPAGFGSHEDTIARYSELMGRPMRDIFYYEIFSGFRFAVVMYRLSDLVFDREDMEGDADMATDNIATQLLAKMLDLAAADLSSSEMGSPVGPTATPAASSRWPSQCVPWSPSSRMASGQPSRIVCSSSTEPILAMTCTVILFSYPGGSVMCIPPKGSSRTWGAGSRST